MTADPDDYPTWEKYHRSQVSEASPWYLGYPMGSVSVSPADKEAGSPVMGDMIFRNPKNHNDQWLVAAKYFKENYYKGAQ